MVRSEGVVRGAGLEGGEGLEGGQGVARTRQLVVALAACLAKRARSPLSASTACRSAVRTQRFVSHTWLGPGLGLGVG